MKILIAGNFQFPFGSASASRIRHFALGLLEAGAEVRVLSQVPLYDRPEDLGERGQRAYEGIPYESAAGYRKPYAEKRSIASRWRWFGHFLAGARKCATRTGELIGEGTVDIALQYNRSYVSLRPFLQVCLRHGVPVVQDVVEWFTWRHFKGGLIHPLFWDDRLAMHRSVPASDAAIGISSFLTEHYTRQGLPAIRIPAVIGVPERPLSQDGENAEEGIHLMYLGKLTPRDEPFGMVGAVRQVLADGYSVRLTVVGTSGVSGFAATVRHYCESDPLLRSCVHFLGPVKQQDVPKYLRPADALIFARPDDISARAAFPTRLPEYLVTGRPVIAAGVGDIPLYLQDGRDALLVNPCTPDAIAGRIRQLLQMPDRGRAVGLAGFERAGECFDYRRRTREMLRFLRDIHSSYARTQA